MTVQLQRPAISTQPAAEDEEFADIALDISIVEGSPAADQLIRMTDDGCNSTCATAWRDAPRSHTGEPRATPSRRIPVDLRERGRVDA